ncbi:glycosyltransferase [Winogradskyella sp. PG-2]|uniref:glycosyltransferase n=1 Tax=Winogradskyella sp. PG-2 TaxID=754409 RepID=UPI0004585DB3|nr:glycosyltransferase [Winogradskyella sp. PG-2]BAO77198.1 glycosyltransferase [Winogradskyella sp. PG-2]
MRLSIIIPVYNVVKFLPRCLDSILEQDIASDDYEILIIDDGSTDNSFDIANAYSKKYANLKVHSKKNGGVGTARNLGVSYSKGNYIYFIDPDDYLAKDVLKTLLEKIESNDLDIMTFISKRTTDQTLQHSETKKPELGLSSILNGESYIAENNYKNEVWWYIIKREFLLDSKIKFIEGRWMEDAILTARLFLKANRMAHFSIDAHRHLIIEGSAMRNKEPSHYIKVIDDNKNAALVFETLIQSLIKKNANSSCIKRLKTRQQSFIFFLMVRMLKSTINLKQVKTTIYEISKTNAYPLNIFPGNDYQGIRYTLLTRLFNHKRAYYFIFRFFNPILKNKKGVYLLIIIR